MRRSMLQQWRRPASCSGSRVQHLLRLLRVLGPNVREFLAKVWRASGGFDRKAAGFYRNSGRSRFKGVWPLGAARFGHVSACFGHVLGLETSCPKGAARGLLQEAWRDQAVPRAGAVTEVCRQFSFERGSL